MQKRRFLSLGLVFGLGLLALITTACPPAGEDGVPTPTPEDRQVVVTDLDVGLPAAETAVWRTTSEGSDLLPVDILRALVDIHTGKPFSESLTRYGFLESPASAENPYGLPVGWTIHVPDFSLLRLDYAGLNCSACHTGQVEHSGRGLRIDGAPNMVDFEGFVMAARESVIDMLDSPEKTFLFIWRLVKLEPPSQASPEATFGEQLPERARALLDKYAAALQNDEREIEDVVAREMGKAFGHILRDEEAEPLSESQSLIAGGIRLVEDALESVRRIYELVERYKALLRNRIEVAMRAVRAIETSPLAGPGRDDPWGIIRNLVFFSEFSLTAPTSIPHLYWSRDFGWYHADGNTNSVMQRDIAQAVALGAYVDPETNESTLVPRAVWVLEDLMRKLESPAWPETVFGPIDAEAAARGALLFERKMAAPGGGELSCANCHASRQGVLIALNAVGTDPNRAENFLRPQDGEPFWVAIPDKVRQIEAFVFEKAGISPEEAREHEPNFPPQWRGTGKYVARRLDGVWSTAPYLHNGSVPTLFDLLLPADERPLTFPLGHREYDPEKVGYVTETADPVFVFDVAENGNSNAGHEYGTTLSEEERRDLVEYLKTL